MSMPRVLLLVSLSIACQDTLTADEFEQELFELQCQLDTCHHADDSCSAFAVQPRASDCDFDPQLGLDCLDAVEALIDETPEMWVTDGEYGWCVCGDPEWHDLDWEGETCEAMPTSDDLPPACDVVCTDLL